MIPKEKGFDFEDIYIIEPPNLLKSVEYHIDDHFYLNTLEEMIIIEDKDVEKNMKKFIDDLQNMKEQ